ncbi:MAG: amino acid ABC transporter permease [Terrisporobacter othiniensis]|uniref:amino acid ABC transporter permease n=1 Tax=Terrisporobacter TaxID=1505652 RepID=UPI0008E2C679|nr:MULTISPECIES: amino acid ABC transporter permease [Terrisporobacter]MBN9648018.1 amino acid ABC transporter permease [Terrisporobacter glycolicus]MDU4862524.1 amino acid ABC transporter permease [Terrisporobacter othiniensis]MDU6996153.1 amino acid ABC transporter permease [Terrisporobacter othiniensis]SFJ52638.1 putative amino-acid transport system permease protein [Terrisporobacter glycolicus]HBI93209.1 amino acid ABC transporter permease [Terrisporobacter hibernicus]
MQIFDFEFVANLIPIMIKYLGVTFKMSLLALVLGIVVAMVIALVVDADIPVLKRLSKIYISFFRGTPLVAQLFFIYFGLIKIIPSLKELSAFNAAVIVLGLNSSAYFAESLRGAISSVDKGQAEACYAFGMTYTQAMVRIILPQAIRVAIPAMTNTFADIIKGSSLAFTIGVTEIMATAQSEAAATYKYLEAFTCVVIIYWLINLAVVYVQNKLEKKLSEAY